MSDKHPRKIDTSHLQNPNVKHEKSDVRIKPLIMFAVYLTIAAAIIHVMMYLLFQYFEDRAVISEGPPSPLAAERQALPPEPRLQLSPSEEGQDRPNLREHPLEELKFMQAEERTALTEYGWVDQQSGVVRLPIERAKQLLFEKGGLPSRGQSQQAQSQQAQSQGAQETRAPDEGVPSDSSGGTLPELRYK
jgi:hypothetical protein